MNNLALLDKVNELEKTMCEMEQRECPVWHFFAPGLYARQMLILKHTCLTGVVHKTEHLCIISGDIEVTTDNGVRRIKDQQRILVSKPGTKRAGFTREDTIWTTVHATTTTDLDALVEELTESTNAELLGGSKNKQFLLNQAKRGLIKE
jgi:hypothetical protein